MKNLIPHAVNMDSSFVYLNTVLYSGERGYYQCMEQDFEQLGKKCRNNFHNSLQFIKY